jgi:hypothetical protein
MKLLRVLKFSLVSFVFIGLLTSANCNEDPPPTSEWVSTNFYWSRGTNYQIGGCQFPYTCDYNYIRFDPITDPGALEGTYRAKITVSSTGGSKSYIIVPGSADNSIILNGNICSGTEGYILRLLRPLNQQFTVTLELWLTCSSCGAGTGNRQYWRQDYSFLSPPTTIQGPLFAPSYYGIVNC